MNDVCKCYLGNQLCCAVRGIPALQTNYSGIFQDCGNAIVDGTISSRICPSPPPYEKLPYIKAQLACACAMLVVCALYVILFLFACFGVCFGHD